MKKNYIIIFPTIMAILLLTLYFVDVPSPSVEIKETLNLEIK